jgi:hypothetical protein
MVQLFVKKYPWYSYILGYSPCKVTTVIPISTNGTNNYTQGIHL